MNNYVLVPEWTPQKGVLLTWPAPHTDWAYMLEQAQSCYVEILRALVRYQANPSLLVPSRKYALQTLPSDLSDSIPLIEAEYNDTWIRDYGPLTLKASDGKLCLADFGFNGWGLKFPADKDNLVTHRLFGPDSSAFCDTGAYRNYLGYVLEGGSLEVDADATLLTTTRCLCSPNRNGGLSKAQVQAILSKALGIKHFLWLDYGEIAGDDTDSHIDTLARMAPDETILYTACADPSDIHYESMRLMREQLQRFRTPEGSPYNLIELPLPAPIYDEADGHRLPATYANYLVTDKAVLMPAYGQPQTDELACKIVKIAYPHREIVPIDCRALIRQHGSLHCATMQLNY